MLLMGGEVLPQAPLPEGPDDWATLIYAVAALLTSLAAVGGVWVKIRRARRRKQG